MGGTHFLQTGYLLLNRNAPYSLLLYMNSLRIRCQLYLYNIKVFAEKGYDIFLVHYGEKEKADAVADIVQNKYGRKCKCMDINLSNSDAAVKILNCVLETYGRIDALLSNAGMGYERYLTTAHVEEIDMIYKVNYRAGILLGREVGKYMKEHNIQGCMVFTSSVKAFQPTPIDGIYGGMKAALRRTVQSLSREMAPYNIRVNIVAPGCIAVYPKGYENQDYSIAQAGIPLGRCGTPKDIGYAAAFLCSEEANYITGTELCVDGGVSSGFCSDDELEKEHGEHGVGAYVL